MADLKFVTRVSGEKDGIHFIRNQPLADLVAKSSFSAAVFYMITGIMPDPHQERVLNAILVASLDHGLSPASGFVPRVVASTGNNIIHSMAAGLLALGPYHGGAIEPAAQIFQQVREKGVDSLEQTHFSPQKRLAGFGHPHYKHSDPRADQLFSIAKSETIGTQYQEVAFSVQQAIHDRLGKHLVINIDGAIAAILLDLGFPVAAGNGLFALARCGGMIAHIIEEYQEKPVRRIDESEIVFNPISPADGHEE